MRLNELIKNIKLEKVYNFNNISVSSICSDSREAKRNSLFVAIKGERLDGNNYIKQAISKGAKVIVFEGTCAVDKKDIIFIKVSDTRKAVALIAKNYYKDPSSKIKIVGVTGTNGKTTTVTSLYSITRSLGYHTALLSTIENRIDNERFETNNTTPDPIIINKFLDEALKHRCKFVFMECSSHAIDQKRIYGLNFFGGVFTNLTRDHLDYHKTFKKYAFAKREFFNQLSKKSFALANKDDKRTDLLLANTKAKKYYFSLNSNAKFRGKILSQSLEGLNLEVNGKKIFSGFLGKYNGYNLLEIYAVCLLIGLPKRKIVDCISKLKPPVGRLEFYKFKNDICGVVDYAHTPNALINVLETLNDIRDKKSKIITVIGCGGDRDKTKRPIMGKIAVNFSDFVIFTSDNPRSENPNKIISEMTRKLNQKNYQKITNRKEAIRKAIHLAKKGDVILIAGKGHENYQIFKNKAIHFSDTEILKKYLK
jgi:UDP-N-acetylmuramoyl-L-alanyl-D-glutamate--2,6-diaminopimelate ligase